MSDSVQQGLLKRTQKQFAFYSAFPHWMGISGRENFVLCEYTKVLESLLGGSFEA